MSETGDIPSEGVTKDQVSERVGFEHVKYAFLANSLNLAHNLASEYSAVRSSEAPEAQDRLHLLEHTISENVREHLDGFEIDRLVLLKDLGREDIDAYLKDRVCTISDSGELLKPHNYNDYLEFCQRVLEIAKRKIDYMAMKTYMDKREKNHSFNPDEFTYIDKKGNRRPLTGAALTAKKASMLRSKEFGKGEKTPTFAEIVVRELEDEIRSLDSESKTRILEAAPENKGLFQKIKDKFTEFTVRERFKPARKKIAAAVGLPLAIAGFGFAYHKLTTPPTVTARSARSIGLPFAKKDLSKELRVKTVVAPADEPNREPLVRMPTMVKPEPSATFTPASDATEMAEIKAEPTKATLSTREQQNDDLLVEDETVEPQKGLIIEDERVVFNDVFDPVRVSYNTKYLSEESFQFGETVWQVKPDRIIWHWDGQPNESRNPSITYNGLSGRTREKDPVSAHFSVGPDKILQMLPMGSDFVQQGRLTDDRGIDRIEDAKSLGAINIETTGSWYDQEKPPSEQTQNLIDLTIALLDQYGLKFSDVFGHLEQSPDAGKIDPGTEYLNKTRIELLRKLIKEKRWDLIGKPESWEFYKLVRLKDGTIEKVVTQSREEILASLTDDDLGDLRAANVVKSKPDLEVKSGGSGKPIAETAGLTVSVTGEFIYADEPLTIEEKRQLRTVSVKESIEHDLVEQDGTKMGFLEHIPVSELDEDKVFGEGKVVLPGTYLNKIFNLNEVSRWLTGLVIEPGEEFNYALEIGLEGGRESNYKIGYTVNGTAYAGGACTPATAFVRAFYDLAEQGYPLKITHQPHSRKFPEYQDGPEAAVFIGIDKDGKPVELKNLRVKNEGNAKLVLRLVIPEPDPEKFAGKSGMQWVKGVDFPVTAQILITNKDKISKKAGIREGS